MKTVLAHAAWSFHHVTKETAESICEGHGGNTEQTFSILVQFLPTH